ncbi:unnamed protein product, partial [Mesorhabditis belari]|uniref:Uncharacterized protein n=1 Tax=Mesorhabditis belari TaxID=2138241 RepID=A0AAF3FET4_9BILA
MVNKQLCAYPAGKQEPNYERRIRATVRGKGNYYVARTFTYVGILGHYIDSGEAMDTKILALEEINERNWRNNCKYRGCDCQKNIYWRIIYENAHHCVATSLQTRHDVDKAVPGSLVSVERLFSRLGIIYGNKTRGRLLPSIVESLVKFYDANLGSIVKR